METIFALATAQGRSGVAVIRISGGDVSPAWEHFGCLRPPEPRKAIFHHFRLADGELIDQGLILYFPAPHSFTGEDCLEFQIHGSVAVVKKFLEELSALPGFRLAEPGEFARRAFTNGKLDLTAAEGLADLIEAETEIQRQQAVVASGGESVRFFSELRANVLHPLALLEAYIDFPEEEIPDSVTREVQETIESLTLSIQESLTQLATAERIREGFTVVILGAPNAGKSSLLNALARREVAIVSDQAGTTRDLIELHLDLGGLPVVLIDTAGIRETEDDIESEGIRRALDRARNAQLKLVLFDASTSPDTTTRALIDAESLIIVTKQDLPSTWKVKELQPDSREVFEVSVRNPQSLTPVLKAMEHRLRHALPSTSGGFVTHQRHRQHLVQAVSELERFREESSLELRCERLRLAAVEIGKITGQIQVDELLDVIFSSFCIGK